MKLKVGDRVLGCGDTSRVGEKGTVCEINGDIVDVVWDNFDGGHSGCAKDGSHNHWRVDITNLKKIDSPVSTKYKVGDWVNVRSYLTTDETYGGIRPSEQMLHKVGQRVKIKAVTKTGRYKIEGSCFTWTAEMFEEEKKESKVEHKVEHKVEKTHRYNAGDKVRVRSDLKPDYHKKYYMADGHTCDTFVGDMAKLCGKIVTIEDVNVQRKYTIVGNDLNWTDEMFELPTYKVATVTFDNDKEYCYLCDISVKKGDNVVVPCGTCDRETIATVVKTGKYTEENAPYPIDKMKKVIRKGTDTAPTSYKVGDRVKILNGTNEGKSGVIYAVNSDNYDVIVDGLTTGHDGDANDGSRNHWYKNKSSVTKIANEEPKPIPKVEVGDVVRAIDNCYGMTNIHRKWEGVVIKVDGAFFDAVTANSSEDRYSEGYYWSLRPEHFEIIKKNT